MCIGTMAFHRQQASGLSPATTELPGSSIDHLAELKTENLRLSAFVTELSVLQVDNDLLRKRVSELESFLEHETKPESQERRAKR